MSNYNTTLQTNNSFLEEIINKLNNMPDAGSGGIDTVLNTIYVGTTIPTADIGNDGDIYIVRSA